MSTEIDRVWEPESHIGPSEAMVQAVREFTADPTFPYWQAAIVCLHAVMPEIPGYLYGEDVDLVELAKIAVSDGWGREDALRDLALILERRRPLTPMG